ncbi:MAG: hypothetical protein Ct9H300mP18_08910 [Candidatus Neomarinimicrobiota bacterium]|nr:MAG: hypothetical protein Ct9H300mP18_08910 [Candidatus Neomarinimicrobiota bacterium]
MAIAKSAKKFRCKNNDGKHLSIKLLLKMALQQVLVLDNGDEYNSNIVISGLDPKLTFLKMIDEIDLPSDFVSAIKNFRIRGSSGKN